VCVVSVATTAAPRGGQRSARFRRQRRACLKKQWLAGWLWLKTAVGGGRVAAPRTRAIGSRSRLRTERVRPPPRSAPPHISACTSAATPVGRPTRGVAENNAGCLDPAAWAWAAAWARRGHRLEAGAPGGRARARARARGRRGACSTDRPTDGGGRGGGGQRCGLPGCSVAAALMPCTHIAALSSARVMGDGCDGRVSMYACVQEALAQRRLAAARSAEHVLQGRLHAELAAR
jgi:hypothetical protein